MVPAATHQNSALVIDGLGVKSPDIHLRRHPGNGRANSLRLRQIGQSRTRKECEKSPVVQSGSMILGLN